MSNHGAMVKEKNGWLLVSIQTETEAWEAWTEVCLRLYSDSATKLVSHLCWSLFSSFVSHLWWSLLQSALIYLCSTWVFFSPYNFKLVNSMEIIMGNVWKIRKVWQHFYWDQRIASNRNWWACQCGYCIVSDQQRLVLEVARLRGNWKAKKYPAIRERDCWLVSRSDTGRLIALS